MRANPRNFARRRKHRRLLQSITLLFLVTLFALLFFPRSNETAKHRIPDNAAEEICPPSPDAITINQLMFVSCNRHDRSQDYWNHMATAAQCEIITPATRSASSICQQLYKGHPTPLLTTAAAMQQQHDLATDTQCSLVPSGACGAVYDTPGILDGPGELCAPLSNSPSTREDIPATTTVAPLDALVWLGDAIYADKKADGKEHQALLSHHTNSLEEVEKMWAAQRNDPDYRAFLKTCVARSPGSMNLSLGTKDSDRKGVAEKKSLSDEANADDRINVFGTWDDHDMGLNDGGKEYQHKKITQNFFLTFLQAPPSDPRWHREGVYTFHTIDFHDVFGPSAANGTLESEALSLLPQVYKYAVCVLLLDTRSFRDPVNATYAGDMLGEEQWIWVEEKMEYMASLSTDGRQMCAATVVGSGIQFSLDEKPSENWAAFPYSRDRLLGIIAHHKVERLFFVTGDVHLGELGADFSAHTITKVLGYPLVEATSSGLTHSANMLHAEWLVPRLCPTVRRVGIYIEKNFGSIQLSLNRRKANDAAFISRNLLAGNNVSATRQHAKAFLEDAVNITLTVFSIPQEGRPVLRITLPLSMLTHKYGKQYVDAKVNPCQGSILLPAIAHGQQTAAPAPTWTNHATVSITLKSGEKVVVSHYPTTPYSPFTFTIHVLQHFIFRSQNLSRTLVLSVLYLIAFTLCLSICIVWRICIFFRCRLKLLQVCPSAQSSKREKWSSKVFNILAKEKST